ncbi:AsmA family protein [Hyphomicrobium sulfonivorans]|uniref:AsmA family protein n=1 Tax=Hyphomicrobium sulfonivorans TaxID=121290 RepID=UPI00156FACFD|nr:AsmA family protein [Hyphomicrobium sulfonivorans]MBI1648977.1 AsmA family protein [Hyphomicrobium sulfonivorans]NSL70488.1 hypothetical protein [Hyphomicrobium sulfonivorans]
MSNGLLYIAGLISLALAALFAVPYFVDWNGYRGVFEEEATRILGREVRVGGNVNVRLLPQPYVSFEKLRIADPTGATGEPLFRAESFTMRLSVPPLLKGIIEANEVVLEKPELRLAVDAEGAGNWRDFSIAPGSLPFVPAGVSLQSVMVNDGSVALFGPRGINFADLTGINGELKADSFSGPFGFKGTTHWREGTREVRLVTGATEADGSLRFKATVRDEGDHLSSYSVDGRIDDIKNVPRISGDLTAKLALASGALAQANRAGAASGNKKLPPVIDFRAKIDGNATGMRVDDIAMTFENVGQPQLISGAATARWEEALSVDMGLTSRWLDLDLLAMTEDGADNPIATARNFIGAVMAALPKNADSKVTLDLDQANLGGEPVSGTRLELARTDGVLHLDRLRAGLPGGTRLALDGAVAEQASGQSFRGDVTLHGTSLARFLDWSAKGRALAEALRNDGAFSLQGQLAMSDGGIRLTEAGVEVAGRPLTGEFHLLRGERPRVQLVLEGAEVDAGQFWQAGIGAFKRVVSRNGTDAAAAPGSEKFAWFDPQTMDFDVRLRAGQFLAGEQKLRNVSLDVGVDGGKLAIRTCRFDTADGLKFDLEGDVRDAASTPQGALRWAMKVPSAAAYSTLVSLLDPPQELRDQAAIFSTLAPMSVAGSIGLGARNSGSADITADGAVQGSGRLIATALLDGGLGNWRAAPADITLTINSSPDVARILASLGARDQAQLPASATPKTGEVFIKAVGVPAQAMAVSALAQGPQLFLGYDGRAVLPAASGSTLDGELRLSARGLGEVMSVAGLGGGVTLSETPVVGTVRVKSASHATELDLHDLRVGDSKVSGTLALAYPSEGPAIVTGELDVDAATVPGLLALVTDHKTITVDGADTAEPLTAGRSIWPERAFDFSALDGVEGKLGVDFGSLSVIEGMAIAKARVEIALTPGKVEVSKLEGRLLGGELTSRVVLEKAAGGAALDAVVNVSDMRVRKTDNAEMAEQQASLALDIKARASTPGTMVSVATGAGELRLGNLLMRVPTPQAVVSTARAALTGEAGASGEELAEALRTAFTSREVMVGQRIIPIEIGDGAAKLASFTLDSDAGSTKVDTTVDLASMMFDSSWLVQSAPNALSGQPAEPAASADSDADAGDDNAGQPLAAPAPTPAARVATLPPISVVYTGRLPDAWTPSTRIAHEPLERELAIRKLELDADQLERLHQADAERVKRQDERRRAREADEDEAAPVPLPSPAPAPTAAPLGFDRSGATSANGAAPALPPSSASALGVVVPQVPGQEIVTFGASPIDPAVVAPTEAGSIPQQPAATTTSSSAGSNGNGRPRRPAAQKQIGPAEQILRNLQNW